MLKREHEASLSALRQRVVSHEDNNAKLTSINAELKASNELFRSKVMHTVQALSYLRAKASVLILKLSFSSRMHVYTL